MNKPSQFYVYGLFDPYTDELRYVGKTNNIENRYKQHLRENATTHKANWIKTLVSARTKPQIIVFEQFTTEKEAIAAEIDLIAYYKFVGCRLTNLLSGGSGSSGRILSEHSRKKIGIASKARNKGRRFSDQHKRRIARALRGRIVRLETRRKLSVARTGKPLPLITRQKISASLAGSKHPCFRRALCIVPNCAKPHHAKDLCQLHYDSIPFWQRPAAA